MFGLGFMFLALHQIDGLARPFFGYMSKNYYCFSILLKMARTLVFLYAVAESFCYINWLVNRLEHHVF